MLPFAKLPDPDKSELELAKHCESYEHAVALLQSSVADVRRSMDSIRPKLYEVTQERERLEQEIQKAQEELAVVGGHIFHLQGDLKAENERYNSQRSIMAAKSEELEQAKSLRNQKRAEAVEKIDQCSEDMEKAAAKYNMDMLTGKIEEVKKQVDHLSSEVSSLQTEGYEEKLDEKIKELEARKRSMEDKTAALQDRLEQLQTSKQQSLSALEAQRNKPVPTTAAEDKPHDDGPDNSAISKAVQGYIQRAQDMIELLSACSERLQQCPDSRSCSSCGEEQRASDFAAKCRLASDNVQETLQELNELAAANLRCDTK